MAKRYISLKVVLDRLLRNTLLEGLSYEALIDYTIDFMDIVNNVSSFIEESYETTIKDYRAELPHNFVEVKQLLIDNIPAVYGSDTFHNQYNKFDNIDKRVAQISFKIQGNYIFTSQKDGNLKMVYTAIPIDEDGFPMIPNDNTFIIALEWYCKLQYYTILFEKGKITDKVYHNTQTEYSWAVGRCQSREHHMNLSEAEAVFNSFTRLLKKTSEFKHRFKNSNSKEIIRKH